MISLLIILTGVFPADSTITILRNTMIEATPQALGMFFAEIGLEAAPDEIFLWSDDNFCELLVEFSTLAPDSGNPDSLATLLNGLPLELLTPAT